VVSATADPIPAKDAVDLAYKGKERKGPATRKGFADTMGFSGWAPEVINGRAAQIAFVSSVGAELATGGARPFAPLSDNTGPWPAELRTYGHLT